MTDRLTDSARMLLCCRLGPLKPKDGAEAMYVAATSDQ